MNTYLIPYFDETDCAILKFNANSYADVQEKIQDYFVELCNDDALADCDGYDNFIYDLDERQGIYLGDIHEIEEYE